MGPPWLPRRRLRVGSLCPCSSYPGSCILYLVSGILYLVINFACAITMVPYRCGQKNTRYTRYRIQDTRYRMQDPSNCNIWDLANKIRDIVVNILDIVDDILDIVMTRYGIRDRTSCILYLVSGIRYLGYHVIPHTPRPMLLNSYSS